MIKFLGTVIGGMIAMYGFTTFDGSVLPYVMIGLGLFIMIKS